MKILSKKALDEFPYPADDNYYFAKHIDAWVKKYLGNLSNERTGVSKILESQESEVSK